MSDLKLTLQAFARRDLPVVVDLINRSDAADEAERGTSEGELELLWGMPGFDPERNAVLALSERRTVGFGRLCLREGAEDGSFSIFKVHGTVAPEWRGRGVGTLIMAELERRARGRLRDMTTETVQLQRWADQQQEDAAPLFRSCGMEAVRNFFQMVHDSASAPAEPQYPTGSESRRLVPGQDEETAWRVANTAFRDHWGHVDDPVEMWLSWFPSDCFSPDLALLGHDGSGEVVGVSLSPVNPEENRPVGRERGWVETLAVLRGHRGKGLGRALLLESVHVLRERGCTPGMLGVDSENATGALGLYESVGFRLWMITVTFRKVLRGRRLPSSRGRGQREGVGPTLADPRCYPGSSARQRSAPPRHRPAGG